MYISLLLYVYFLVSHTLMAPASLEDHIIRVHCLRSIQPAWSRRRRRLNFRVYTSNRHLHVAVRNSLMGKLVSSVLGIEYGIPQGDI